MIRKLFQLTIFLLLAMSAPLGCVAQVITWNTPVVQNTGGSGSANTTGSGISLQLTGGTDANNSTVLLSSTTDSQLNFTDPGSNGIKLSLGDFALGGVNAGNQIFMLTVTPTPSSLPYYLSSALSLQVRSNGSFSLGWRENYQGAGGWPSRTESKILESGLASSYVFTGIELILTNTSYELKLSTSSNGVLTYSGLLQSSGDPVGNWGDLGVSFVLQKTQAGSGTSAFATVGSFDAQVIPEPGSMMLMGAAGLLLFSCTKRRLKPLLLASGLMAGHASQAVGESDSFALVVDGAPQCVILLGENPSRSDLDAASELNYWVNTISDTSLPIQKAGAWDGKTPYIAIGQSAMTQSNGWSVDGLAYEEAKVIIEKERIGLLGANTVPKGKRPWPQSFERMQAERPKKNSPLGTSGPGTYYAALELIQKRLHVRWIWPGRLGEVYEPRKTVTLEPGQWTWKPFGSFKRHFWDDYNRAAADYQKTFGVKISTEKINDVAIPFDRWRMRQRFNLPEPVTPMIFVSWWKKYHARHPDWFAQAPQNRLPLTHDLAKLNLANPGVIDGIVEDWQREKKNNPELEFYVDITPNDLRGFDVSKATRSLDAPEMQLLEDEKIWMSDEAVLSDRYLHFWNKVSERFLKEFPGTTLLTLAYDRYRKPPLKNDGVIVSENVIIGYVGGEGYYPAEPDFLKDFLGWRQRGAKMYWRPNLLHCGHGMPYLYSRKVQHDLSAMIEQGLIGADYDSLTGNWATQGLNYYVISELHNRPQASYETISGEYFSAFGKAAPAVQAYHEFFEALVLEKAPLLRDKQMVENETWGKFWRGHMRLAAVAFTDSVFDQAERFLIEAEEAVKNSASPFPERVAFLRKGFDHARLTARTFRSIRLGRPGEPLDLDKEKLGALWKMRQANLLAPEFSGARLLNHEQIQFNIWSDFIHNLKIVGEGVIRTPIDGGWECAEAPAPGRQPEAWRHRGMLNSGEEQSASFYRTVFQMPQLHDNKQYAVLQFEEADINIKIRINGRRVPSSQYRLLKGGLEDLPTFVINILDFVEQAKPVALEVEASPQRKLVAKAVSLLTHN